MMISFVINFYYFSLHIAQIISENTFIQFFIILIFKNYIFTLIQFILIQFINISSFQEIICPHHIGFKIISEEVEQVFKTLY